MSYVFWPMASRKTSKIMPYKAGYLKPKITLTYYQPFDIIIAVVIRQISE
jgi:hypothetical protein